MGELKQGQVSTRNTGKADFSVNSGNSNEKKSGLIQLKQGEVLFHEGDVANSLYIIQKGQLRLYRPKGKGFIELAVLRPGEVLGEMAYFAQDESESRRSCSAEAMLHTEVIEISFNAFAKTMNNLNPWFKTIINTLASRLRKTNSKVKELESNSVAQGYGSGPVGYQFFRSIDVVRFLCAFYLLALGQGEAVEGGRKLHKNTLKFYTLDVFNLGEAKFEEFINLLISLKLLKVLADKDNMPNIFLFPDVTSLKNIMIFFNAQRVAADNKKIKVSEKCETFLEKILEQIIEKRMDGPKADVDIKVILEDFKNRNIHVNLEDLNQAKDLGFVSEIMVGNNNDLSCSVDCIKLKNTFLPIRMINAVERVNSQKARQ